MNGHPIDVFSERGLAFHIWRDLRMENRFAYDRERRIFWVVAEEATAWMPKCWIVV